MMGNLLFKVLVSLVTVRVLGVILGVVRNGVLGVVGIGIWDPFTGVFTKVFLGVVKALRVLFCSLKTLLVGGLENNICFLDSRCSWNNINVWLVDIL